MGGGIATSSLRHLHIPGAPPSMQLLTDGQCWTCCSLNCFPSPSFLDTSQQWRLLALIPLALHPATLLPFTLCAAADRLPLLVLFCLFDPYFIKHQFFLFLWSSSLILAAAKYLQLPALLFWVFFPLSQTPIRLSSSWLLNLFLNSLVYKTKKLTEVLCIPSNSCIWEEGAWVGAWGKGITESKV